MKNAMQLKAKIRNISKNTGISSQLVLQNYMLERLLQRISSTKYRENFILKGGFLIASIVGLNTRATMDMDITLKGLKLNQKMLLSVFSEICNANVDDSFEFEIKKIQEIREGDIYSGYRIGFVGKYPPMAVPLKLDITTGDKITPKEISFKYKLLFDEGYLNILAYNLETILAEKLETIISRGNQNTRPRDFYDTFILSKLKWNKIDFRILKEALEKTMERRGTLNHINNYESTITTIKDSEQMKNHWKNYQNDFDYAVDISFSETIDSVTKLLDEFSR